jgi:hypothetical protein
VLDAGYSLYTFSVGFSLGPSTAELHHASASQAFAGHWVEILLPLLVFGALAVLGLREARRSNSFGFSLLLATMLIPVILSAILAALKGIPMYPRYILASAVPYWIAIALGVKVCLHTPATRTLPTAAAALIAFSLYNHYWQPDYAKQDVRSATALINKTARKGDIVIISSTELGGPFIYYLKRSDMSYVGYPSKPGLVDPKTLQNEVQCILMGRKRAWLILGRTWSSDPNGHIPTFFTHHYRPLLHRHHAGVDTYLYELSPKP